MRTATIAQAGVDVEPDQRTNHAAVDWTISKSDAEVLLGVLSSERYNAEVEAVCDGVRRQLDEKPPLKSVEFNYPACGAAPPASA